MAYLKSCIPERIKNSLGHLLYFCLLLRLIKDQQINIRIWKKLLTAIATKGNQGNRAGKFAGRLLKMLTDKGIDQPALLGKQGLTTQTLLPQFFQGSALGSQMRCLH